MIKGDPTTNNEYNNNLDEVIYTRDDIYRYFKRKIPDKKIYQERLEKEIDLILSKNLFENMIKALDILEITKNIYTL